MKTKSYIQENFFFSLSTTPPIANNHLTFGWRRRERTPSALDSRPFSLSTVATRVSGTGQAGREQNVTCKSLADAIRMLRLMASTTTILFFLSSSIYILEKSSHIPGSSIILARVLYSSPHSTIDISPYGNDRKRVEENDGVTFSSFQQ